MGRILLTLPVTGDPEPDALAELGDGAVTDALAWLEDVFADHPAEREVLDAIDGAAMLEAGGDDGALEFAIRDDLPVTSEAALHWLEHALHGIRPSLADRLAEVGARLVGPLREPAAIVPSWPLVPVGDVLVLATNPPVVDEWVPSVPEDAAVAAAQADGRCRCALCGAARG